MMVGREGLNARSQHVVCTGMRTPNHKVSCASVQLSSVTWPETQLAAPNGKGIHKYT